MTRLSTRIALTTAICALAGAPALAQSMDSAGMSGDMAGKSPDAITCADLVAMESRLIPGALYFISGYKQAHDMGGGAAAAPTAPAEGEGAGSAVATSGSGTGSEGDASAAAQGGEMAADASGDTAAGDGADEIADGSGDSGADMDSAAVDDSAGASSDGATGDQSQMVRVTGLFEIPIEQVVTVCTDSPDMTASDAVEQHRSGAMNASGGSAGDGSSN